MAGGCISDVGRVLATYAYDNTVRLWALDGGACVRVLPLGVAVSRVVMSLDGGWAGRLARGWAGLCCEGLGQHVARFWKVRRAPGLAWIRGLGWVPGGPALGPAGAGGCRRRAERGASCRRAPPAGWKLAIALANNGVLVLDLDHGTAPGGLWQVGGRGCRGGSMVYGS